jgi:hypothetical protein
MFTVKSFHRAGSPDPQSLVSRRESRPFPIPIFIFNLLHTPSKEEFHPKSLVPNQTLQDGTFVKLYQSLILVILT